MRKRDTSQRYFYFQIYFAAKQLFAWELISCMVGLYSRSDSVIQAPETHEVCCTVTLVMINIHVANNNITITCAWKLNMDKIQVRAWRFMNTCMDLH